MNTMFTVAMLTVLGFQSPVQERVRPPLNYYPIDYDSAMKFAKERNQKVVVFVDVPAIPFDSKNVNVCVLYSVPNHKDWAEFRDGATIVGEYQNGVFVRVGKLSREDSTPEKLNVILNSSIRPVLFTPDMTFQNNQQFRFQPFQTLRTCVNGNCPLQR